MSDLLGAYKSNLTVFHYDELLTLVRGAVSVGDFGGGALFDQKSVLALRQQGQDFSSLPTITAGSRATADSLQFLFDLLNARIRSISRERDDFLLRMQTILTLIDKDTTLLDQLIAAANMEYWVATVPALTGSQKFYLDFAESHGVASLSLPLSDPATGVIPARSVLDTSQFSNQLVHRGISAPIDVSAVKPIALTWTYQTKGSVEELYSSDLEWTSLTFLEPRPVLEFGSPSVTVLSPEGGSVDGIFSVTGDELTGNLEIYIRTLFYPRRINRTVVFSAAGDTFSLSPYAIDLGDLIVIDDLQSYEQGFDYLLSPTGQITALSSTADKSMQVFYTEYFPAYQSSVNRINWSPIIMLDPGRPYPDDTAGFSHLTLKDGWFPITDETGKSVGLWLSMQSVPSFEYICQVSAQATSTPGVEAVLEIEFDKPTYLNGIHLNPFTNFPFRLFKIESEGLGGTDRQLLLSPNFSLSAPADFLFVPQLVRKAYLTFVQDNYTLKNHVVNPAGQLRSEWMAKLESVLPFPARVTVTADSRTETGAQYEFGLNEILGISRQYNSTDDIGVFLSGPHQFPGVPDLLRLDFDSQGICSCYLIDAPADSNGMVLASRFLSGNAAGVPIQSGQTVVYTPPLQIPASVSFYIKFVLRSEDAIAERFLLQVKGV